jgi:hypothetical protein
MSFSLAKVDLCRRSTLRPVTDALPAKKFADLHRTWRRWSCTLRTAIYPAVGRLADVQTIVGTWLSLVERTLGVGEVASSNLVVPTNFSSASHNGG